jgi:adhesin transport system outer membrane protein
MRGVLQSGFFAAVLLFISPVGEGGRAWSMSLTEAVAIAVDSNPDIGQAIANREAIEFELRQGRGLYLPRIDLEGDLGGEMRDNSTTHATNDERDIFFRRQGSIVMRQMLFDGFKTDAEVQRQASRVDGASFRVAERSQFIALSVIREYLDIIRLRRSVDFAKQNITFHQRLLTRIKEGTVGGSISIADRQQAQERLFAATARLPQIREELTAAEARFIKLVGQAVGSVKQPAGPGRHLPPNLDATLGYARKNHPTIKIAMADLDAAIALVKKVEGDFYPQLSLEARGTAGAELGGVRGHDYGGQVGVVMTWNLYNGGIDRAHVQEQVRRVDEERMKLHQISRDVDEAVRISWSRRMEQAIRLRELQQEFATQNQVVISYNEQFNIGQRSLLDLLDAQNGKFSVQISVETAAAATLFAEYRILAATGTLLQKMAIKEPPAADAYARSQANVPPTPPADTMPRYSPNRDGSLGPLY